MDRRTFLRTTTAAAATTTVVAESAAAREPQMSAPAVARGVRELSLYSPWNSDLPVFADMAADLTSRLQTALGDRYRITVPSTAAGESDLVFSPPESIVPPEPAFAYFGGLPGALGLAPHAHQAWLTIGGGQMLWDDLSAPQGWKPLLAGHTGSQPGLWANRALHSAADFADGAVAISGIGGRVAAALGASPVDLPPENLASALRNGRICASEWGNPLSALMLGLPAAATHHYHEGIFRNGSTLSLNVRLPVWNGLSASDQAILEGVAATTFARSVAEFSVHQKLAAEAISRANPALKVGHLPPPVSKAVDEAAFRAVMDIAQALPDNTRIHQSHSAFQALVGAPGDIRMPVS